MPSIMTITEIRFDSPISLWLRTIDFKILHVQTGFLKLRVAPNGTVLPVMMY